MRSVVVGRLIRFNFTLTKVVFPVPPSPTIRVQFVYRKVVSDRGRERSRGGQVDKFAESMEEKVESGD